jgi:1-acyl-sn-glycerol-3-phosphate acyltransferase
MVTGVLWHRLTYQTLLEKTVETPFLGTLTRLLGGVPLPRGMSGVQKVLQTVPDAFRYRPFFHFYPEGECYMYNQQIQPFKPGAFYIAAKLNVPVIPIVNIHSEGRGKCVQSERRTRRCRPRKRPFMTWSVLDPLYPADYVHRGANSMPSADCTPDADGEPDADGVRAFAEAVRAAMQKAIDAKNEEDPRYGTQKFYKGKMPRLKGINE